MISDNAIKSEFIIRQLKDVAGAAFRFQLNSFNSNLKSRTGSTERALSTPIWTIQASGSEFILSAYITKQLRLQDLGFRKLYTKLLFGALKHTYHKLYAGIGDDLKRQIGDELQNALSSK